jgi:patatin-like phospholipase/acyl hydrolase
MDTGSKENSGDDLLDIPSRVSSVLNELDLFLVDQDKTLLSLNKYPRIKELFLRFNTALPSSALVERLFSAGPLISTIRRNRLSDCLFETLLILKVYKGI